MGWSENTFFEKFFYNHFFFWKGEFKNVFKIWWTLLSNVWTTNENSLHVKQFKERVISKHFDHPWPARSPDMSQLDFWFWNHVKRRVYSHGPAKNFKELKNRIEIVADEVTSEQISNAWSSFIDRLHLIIEEKVVTLSHLFSYPLSYFLV